VNNTPRECILAASLTAPRNHQPAVLAAFLNAAFTSHFDIATQQFSASHQVLCSVRIRKSQAKRYGRWRLRVRIPAGGKFFLVTTVFRQILERIYIYIYIYIYIHMHSVFQEE